MKSLGERLVSKIEEISNIEVSLLKLYSTFTFLFKYTISKMQTKDRNRMLIIGDSLKTDILGGIYNGIDTCWFNPNHKANTLGIEPTYEIDKLKTLVKKL